MDDDVVKVSIEGSAKAIDEMLSGKTSRANERARAAENQRDHLVDELELSRSRERTAISENERLVRLVQEQARTIQSHEETISRLRARAEDTPPLMNEQFCAEEEVHGACTASIIAA